MNANDVLKDNRKPAAVIRRLVDVIELLADALDSVADAPDFTAKAREEARLALCNAGVSRLCVTNAPKDYDYGYVIEVDPEYAPATNVGVNRSHPYRLVAIPYASVEYQLGRYRSGLYLAQTFTQYTEMQAALRGDQ